MILLALLECHYLMEDFLKQPYLLIQDQVIFTCFEVLLILLPPPTASFNAHLPS